MDSLYSYEETRILNLIKSLELILEQLKKFDFKLRSSLLDENFLSDAELSKLLKIDRRTLKRYRNCGKIPYYKLKGKILYKESDIYELIEKHYYPSFAVTD